MIRVIGLKIGSRKEVDYEEGITVAIALERAGVTVPDGGTVTMDRQVVENPVVVPDGAKLVVTPPVDNG